MNNRNVFSASAVLGLLLGVGLVLTPATVVSIFGYQTDAIGLVNAQFTGSTYLGFAWLAWNARHWTDDHALDEVKIAFLIAYGVTGLVALMMQLANPGNITGWVIVVLDGLFAAAFAYLRWMKT